MPAPAAPAPSRPRLPGRRRSRAKSEIDDGNIRWLELPMAVAQELGAQRLEIDLREVTFIDGAVMNLLCRMSWTLPLGPTAIRVWVQPRFASLLRRVRLDQVPYH